VTEHLLDEAARQYETLGAAVFLRAADSLHLTCARLNGLAELTPMTSISLLPPLISASKALTSPEVRPRTIGLWPGIRAEELLVPYRSDLRQNGQKIHRRDAEGAE